MSEIPVVYFTRAGTTMSAPVHGDVTNGHTMPNDGSTGLLVANTDAAAAHTLTIHLARVVDGQTVVPRTVSVPAATSLALGPFSPSDYGADVVLGADSASLTLLAIRST